MSILCQHVYRGSEMKDVCEESVLKKLVKVGDSVAADD